LNVLLKGGVSAAADHLADGLVRDGERVVEHANHDGVVHRVPPRAQEGGVGAQHLVHLDPQVRLVDIGLRVDVGGRQSAYGACAIVGVGRVEARANGRDSGQAVVALLQVERRGEPLGHGHHDCAIELAVAASPVGSCFFTPPPLGGVVVVVGLGWLRFGLV
jgi:hypothetical protein